MKIWVDLQSESLNFKNGPCKVCLDGNIVTHLFLLLATDIQSPAKFCGRYLLEIDNTCF